MKINVNIAIVLHVCACILMVVERSVFSCMYFIFAQAPTLFFFVFFLCMYFYVFSKYKYMLSQSKTWFTLPYQKKLAVVFIMLDNRTVKFTLPEQPPTGSTQWQYYNKTQEIFVSLWLLVFVVP